MDQFPFQFGEQDKKIQKFSKYLQQKSGRKISVQIGTRLRHFWEFIQKISEFKYLHQGTQFQKFFITLAKKFK